MSLLPNHFFSNIYARDEHSLISTATRSPAYRLVKGGWGLQLLPQMLPYSSLLYQEPRRGRQVYRLVKGGQGLLQSTLAGILQGRAWGQCLLKVSLLTLLVLRTRSFLNSGFYSKHYIHVTSTPFILASIHNIFLFWLHAGILNFLAGRAVFWSLLTWDRMSFHDGLVWGEEVLGGFLYRPIGPSYLIHRPLIPAYLICFLGVFIVVCLNFRCYDVFYGCAIFKPFVKSQAVYSCPHKGLLRKCAVLLGLQRVFLGNCKGICLMPEFFPKSKPGICSRTNFFVAPGAGFG